MKKPRFKNTITVFCVCLIAAALTIGCSGGMHADSAEEHDHEHGQLSSSSTDQHGSGENEEGHEKEENGSRQENHEQDHEDIVRLSGQEMKEFGIEVERAGSGEISLQLTLPGEIGLNEDDLVHVVPRFPGVVRTVNRSLGDRVRAGEVLAVIESWVFAEAAAAHVAATMRLELAEANFNREKDLHLKKITALEDFLKAKQELIEARIEFEKAEQKHSALDLKDNDHGRGKEGRGVSGARYEITAPIDGTVIRKHLSLGEVIEADTEAFLLADLSTVWVDLSVYQKDLPFVREGQKVKIIAGHGIPDAQAKIGYVGPVVGERTRTALARVVLPNPEGHWRPGLFVTARVDIENARVPVTVKTSAIQQVHGQSSVFVKTDDGFRAQPVTLGAEDENRVEITSGLQEGRLYVTKGSFTLKAQLDKGTFGHGHIH